MSSLFNNELTVTRNLRSHIDLHTHAVSACGYCVTLTFLPRGDCYVLYIYQVWCL